jgi:hypothetical protein
LTFLLRYTLTIPAGQGTLIDTCSSVAGYDARLSWGLQCDVCTSSVDDACGLQSSITIPVQSQATTVFVLVSGYQAQNTGTFTLSTQCSTSERLSLCVCVCVCVCV